MNTADFSSWPPAQEQTFVVYEQQTAQSSQKALMFGAIAGAITLVLAVVVYASAPAKEHGKAKKEAAGSVLTKGAEAGKTDTK